MTLAGRVSGHCDQVWLKSVKLWLSYKHECGCQKKEEERATESKSKAALKAALQLVFNRTRARQPAFDL